MRNDADLFVPVSRLRAFEKFPLYEFPRAWQEFSEYDVKILRLKEQFNKALKLSFLTKLKANYTCTRMLCPVCHLTQVSSDADENEDV